MTNDEIICGALAAFELPVAENAYRGDAEKYFVYDLIDERDAATADNDAEEYRAEYYLHYFCREEPGPMKRAVRARLKAAGIGVENAYTLYDEEAQERFHLVFDIFVLNGEATPTPTVVITENGPADVTGAAIALVDVRPTVTLQDKTATPTEQTQSLTADEGFDGMGEVTVEAIPPEYIVPSGSMDITANGNGIDVTDKAAVNVNIPTRENDLKCLIEGTIVGEFVIPDGTTYIKIAKFRQCRQMTSCIIPDSVVTIEQEMFRECSGLVSVVLPKNLTMIPEQMFRECTALRSIKIPGTVISIGNYGFNNCRSLMLCDCTELSQTDGQVNTTLGTYGFSNMPLDGKILFKDEETANVYKVATQWSNYANRMTWVGEEPSRGVMIDNTEGRTEPEEPTEEE